MNLEFTLPRQLARAIAATRRAALLSATIAGFAPDQLAAVLDQVFDVATRAGLHCAPQAHRTAGSLDTGALRFSPGYFTTPAEIQYVGEALHDTLRV